MALIAHYKLDGDATDSVNNNTLTSVNTGGYTTGKIGQALNVVYSGGATTVSLSSLGINALNGSWSITLWAKPNYDLWNTLAERFPLFEIGNYYIAGQTSITWSRHNFTAGSRILVLQTYDNQIAKNGFVRTFTVDELSDWFFFSLTFDGTNLSMYSMPVKTGTIYYNTCVKNWSSPFADNIFLGGYGWDVDGWRSLIDDVKIYNHALSPKEIKELSLAKVLHYNFDDFQEPTTNLETNLTSAIFTQCYNGTNYGFGASTDLQQTDIGDSSNGCAITKVNRITGGTSQADYVFHAAIAVSANETKTLSFKYFGTYGTSLRLYGNTPGTTTLYYLNSNNEWVAGGTGTVTVPVVENVWQTITVKAVNTGTAGAEAIGWIILHANSFPVVLANTHYWMFTDWMIEIKDHATPFVNGSRTGTVHDVSGYNNDATLALATTPQWYEDGIGKGCYRFNGTTSGIERIGDFSDIKTISMWVNSQTVPTDSRVLLVHQPTGVGLGFYNNGYLILTSTGNSQRTAIISNFKNNDWNHIAVTYSDAKVPTCYINGAETTYSTTNYWTVPETTLYIGRRTSGSAFDGQIDDVRIYATALSADDVKELYQTRANLDNVGNLFTKCIALPEDVTTGLTNYWNFDSNAVDSVSGNNGTVTGATLTSGIINGAYSFNGTSNYITLASTINLNSNANWTVILWAKTIDDNGTFLSNSSGGPVYSRFGIAGGKIEYYHYNGGWLTKTGNITVNTDNWVMLTWINRSNATMDMYVNGVLDYGNFSSTLSSAGAVNQFGKDWSSNYFAGLMDDVRIYNRCLTPSEIKLLYSKGFR